MAREEFSRNYHILGWRRRDLKSHRERLEEKARELAVEQEVFEQALAPYKQKLEQRVNREVVEAAIDMSAMDWWANLNFRVQEMPFSGQVIVTPDEGSDWYPKPTRAEIVGRTLGHVLNTLGVENWEHFVEGDSLVVRMKKDGSG